MVNYTLNASVQSKPLYSWHGRSIVLSNELGMFSSLRLCFMALAVDDKYRYWYMVRSGASISFGFRFDRAVV